MALITKRPRIVDWFGGLTVLPDFISLGWCLVCYVPSGLTSFSVLVSLDHNTFQKEKKFTFPTASSLLEVASLSAGSGPWALPTSLMKPLPVPDCFTFCSAHRARLHPVLVQFFCLLTWSECCSSLKVLTQLVMWFVKFKQSLRKWKELQFLMVTNGL